LCQYFHSISFPWRNPPKIGDDSRVPKATLHLFSSWLRRLTLTQNIFPENVPYHIPAPTLTSRLFPMADQCVSRASCKNNRIGRFFFSQYGRRGLGMKFTRSLGIELPASESRPEQSIPPPRMTKVRTMDGGRMNAYAASHHGRLFPAVSYPALGGNTRTPILPFGASSVPSLAFCCVLAGAGGRGNLR